MLFLATICFVFLVGSLLSLWITKEAKVWGSLLGISLVAAFFAGFINTQGLVTLIVLLALWLRYQKQPTALLFIVLCVFSLGLRLHFFSGFAPLLISSKLYLSARNAILGLFPLALLVPLSQTRKEWKQAGKGFLLGALGIALIAVPAVLSQAVHWQPKIPSAFALRALNNLLLVCIPEEALYRGFMQNTLYAYFRSKPLALFSTSAIFTLAHYYWSPDLLTFLFIFLAGLLFGGVYMISKRIESAILTHFLLNLIHMTFFTYHAM